MPVTRGWFVRHSATIGALSLLVVAAVGCAARAASAPARPLRAAAPRPALVFENAGIEPVKLYLAERGTEWFVGYVPAGTTEALRLPAAIGPTPPGRQFTLVVVPSTAARSTRGTSGAQAGVITSESFNSDYLTSVRWRVVGRWVVALPDPLRP